MYGFESTSEFIVWLYAVKLDGPCSTVDRWTYGKISITPDKAWKTVS